MEAHEAAGDKTSGTDKRTDRSNTEPNDRRSGRGGSGAEHDRSAFDRFECDGQEDTDTVRACPECATAGIVHRGRAATEDAPYRCNSCNAVFAAPIERENRQHAPKSGLAARLADPAVTDPSDLATDGGELP